MSGSFRIFAAKVRFPLGRAAAATEARLLDDELPKRFREGSKVEVEGLNDWVNRSIRGTLYLLFGAVGLLLAIGCANVSILLMAQGTARQREFAVRAALGANRWRIVRQLLTESMLLATIGLAAGLLASFVILAGIKSVLPRYAFASEVVIRIHFPVLVFSSLVAASTAVLFGLWPALQLSWTQAGQAMAAGSRRVAGNIRGRRTHGALIALQISLTLVLIAAAGSATKAFLELMRTPLGYDPQNAMSVGIPLRENAYADWASRGAYFERLRAKVAETPGVRIAAISSNATPPRNGSWLDFEILGAPAAEGRKASVNLVSPQYFNALRIPLREGRLWSDGENQKGAHVAVINETLARRYFADGGAIGRSLKIPGLIDRPPDALAAPKIAESWLGAGPVAEKRERLESIPGLTPAEREQLMNAEPPP